MKKVFVLISCVLLLISCSSDDSNGVDSIVGQWQMIERFESNVQVEVGCSQYYYTEFMSNNELGGGYIDFSTTPMECATVTFELLRWRKSGNNYEIYVDPSDIISVAYFEGDNLVIEPNSADSRWVYQRL
ncbi:lipocalin family protein [Winogradskyella sp.]|uniref:lipocalin family protein n=1 Tax=Winogradskyella sp. TaxID=1883156 RepID=UPI003BACE567